ncbi:MAG: GNAT family N-acetyltransferase [Ginsengibacter sp.]
MIKPLTYEQLVTYNSKKNALEAGLGLNETSGYISPALKNAIETTILPALANSKTNYMYTTLWVIIGKQENKIIGGISFMGAPDVNGDIEIGYGCYKEFRNKGFMKEAVRGMLEWAGNQPDVFNVTACSNKNNIASTKIISQNKMLLINEAGGIFNWVYKIKNKMYGYHKTTVTLTQNKNYRFKQAER